MQNIDLFCRAILPKRPISHFSSAERATALGECCEPTLKKKSLFCKRALQNRGSFAKKTHIYEEPTNRPLLSTLQHLGYGVAAICRHPRYICFFCTAHYLGYGVAAMCKHPGNIGLFCTVEAPCKSGGCFAEETDILKESTDRWHRIVCSPRRVKSMCALI